MITQSQGQQFYEKTSRNSTPFSKISRQHQKKKKNTVKSQILVRYPFSYSSLETGSYELIFVLSRASKQNQSNKIEIRGSQNKKKFSYSIKFNTFFKSTKVRK